MSKPDKRWAVMRIAVGREEAAAKHLKKLDLECYCPDDAELTGYVPVEPTILASGKHEEVRDLGWVQGFIRDINHTLATVPDEQLEPLRLLEEEEIEKPKYITGPQFYVGEVRKVPSRNPYVDKCWWDMTGRIVQKRSKGGCWTYCLNGEDFTFKKWFTGLQLLGQSV